MSDLLLWGLWVFIGLAFVVLLASACQGYYEDERSVGPCGINGDGPVGD